MTWWTFETLRGATRGSWKHAPASPDARIPGARVSIDSRGVGAGEIFVAIRGERFDGHDFLDSAAKSGAAMLIVDEKSPIAAPKGVPTLAVSDTVRALADLAIAYRNSWSHTTVIGITGSNGKTTTCRLLHAALGSTQRGSCSQKSFNNHFGLPLTLLDVREGDDYVVCEMGTSNPGEIARLSEIARPDAAIITSIGRAHIEGLGGIEGIAAEKCAIAADMRPGGLLLTRDIDGLARHIARTDVRHATFGSGADATHRITRVCAHSSGMSFEMAGNSYSVPLSGEHNAMNAAGVVALARDMGLTTEAINAGLARTEQAEMRFAVERLGDVTMVNDAYNANPDSVRASIRTFIDVTAGARRRILVLGDMLELGSVSEREHRLLGEDVGAETGIDVIVTVGAQARHIGRAAAERNPMLEAHAFDRADDGACAQIASMIRAGDAVLLKGSRGVGLERAAEAIANRRNATAASSGV